MRVALVVPGGVDRGGEERIIPAILWLVERLAHHHDVHVVVPNQEPEPGTWKLRGATVHNVAGHAWRRRAVSQLLRLHRQRPFDVFHAIWARGPGEIAWAAARLCRRPVAVHVMGGELVWFPDIDFGTPRASLRALVRFVVRHADAVTAASAPMLEAVRGVGVTAERLPLGVDTGLWSAREPRPRRDAPVRLVHVGSLTPVKGHGVMLEAVAALVAEGRDVRVELVGVDAWDGEVQRMAARLGLDDRVTFHGYLAPPDVVSVVGGADLMVVASRHEAGPVAMLEAAAVGVPTVGTPVGHVAEWSPEAALAAAGPDAGALTTALRELIDDDDRRIGVAAEAQRRALAEDADWTAARVEDMYRRLTS